MKGSLIIVGFFILGIIAGMTGLLHIDDFGFDVSFTALAMLMFCVGIGVGSDSHKAYISGSACKTGRGARIHCYGFQ